MPQTSQRDESKDECMAFSSRRFLAMLVHVYTVNHVPMPVLRLRIDHQLRVSSVDLKFLWRNVNGFRAGRRPPGESTGLDDNESDAAVRPADYGSPSSPDETETGTGETVRA
jgi:hypothetical protein